jgi:hypothetical protein
MNGLPSSQNVLSSLTSPTVFEQYILGIIPKVGNDFEFLYSIYLSRDDAVQNRCGFAFHPLPVHVQGLPIHISHIAQKLLSDSMLRVPVSEMHPTVVPPEEGLAGKPAEAFR